MLFVYTTHTDLEHAKRLSHTLVEKKLAAGVHLWPVHSLMGIKGECKEGDGVALLIRTFETKLPEVEQVIAAEFSGSIPITASFQVWRINRAYKEWLMPQGFE